jgi:hypothetical protein
MQLDYRTDAAGLLGELTPRRVALPLWLVFAGASICLLSIGVKLDAAGPIPLHAAIGISPIGAAMMLWGVWQLSRLNIDRDYNWMIRGILAVAILQLAKSIADCFPPPNDPVVALLWVFIGMASLVAAMCLSLCMRWISQEAGLRRSARNWLLATIACGCICIPAAIFECVMLILATSGAKSVHIASTQPSDPRAGSALYLPALLLGLLPLLAFALSTWQMQREIARKLGRDSGVVIPLSKSVSSGD